MSLFNFIKYGLWRVSEEICSKYNIYAFIKTKSGLKNINIDALYGDNCANFAPEDIITISPSDLYLTTDFLKDDYTLLNCCILDSPHYGFVEAINNGMDLKKTDYYKRFVAGCLDGRHCQKERDVEYFLKKNEVAKLAIESGNYNPVIVYNYGERYYICDGKHRAALCAFMKKDIRCIVIPSISDFRHSAVTKEIYRIMAGDMHFSRHINFIKDGEK